MESQPSALPPSAPRVVLFDAYGTLFDVYSVALLAEQLFPGQGQRLAVLWRDKQIEYTRLVTTCNDGAHYRPFWELTRAALVFAIKSIANKDLSTLGNGQLEAQVDQLMNQYRHLSAFPENREVLMALKARGVVTGILSNGDPEMLGIAVRSTRGLDGLLDHVISVDPVRRYKTHPDAYALGPKPPAQGARRSSLSAATPGTRWPPPGTATARCGSTAPACRSRNWAPSPPAPAPACATCWRFSLTDHRFFF
jgi:2-haloacid dehalogenase